MATKVAHKDAWRRRREDTRSVEGATVARTSSGTPLRWGQVATSLLHVLAVKSHPTPEYAWKGVDLALSSTKRSST